MGLTKRCTSTSRGACKSSYLLQALWCGSSCQQLQKPTTFLKRWLHENHRKCCHPMIMLCGVYAFNHHECTPTQIATTSQPLGPLLALKPIVLAPHWLHGLPTVQLSKAWDHNIIGGEKSIVLHQLASWP